jgi:hypothetical protein
MVMRAADALQRHIPYGQYTITATSFANAGGWVPQAEVNDGRGGGTEAHSLAWKGLHTFPTRQLADQRAFAMGKRWVDERG